MKVMKVLKAQLQILDDNNILTKIPRATKLILTGHSMGGALAQLMALEMHTRNTLPPNFWIVSFGSPRVGNPDFARVTNEQIMPARNIRFVNEADPIPWLPLRSSGFRHAGTEIWIKAKLKQEWCKTESGIFWACPPHKVRHFTVCRSSCSRAPLNDLKDHVMGRYVEVVEVLQEELGDKATWTKLKQDLEDLN